jgi:hypothetical protein
MPVARIHRPQDEAASRDVGLPEEAARGEISPPGDDTPDRDPYGRGMRCTLAVILSGRCRMDEASAASRGTAASRPHDNRIRHGQAQQTPRLTLTI